MRAILVGLVVGLMAGPAAAEVPCGGDFGGWLQGVKAEAIRAGHAAATVDAFFATAREDAKVLKADRSQGVFRKTFLEFSKSLISDSRMKNGKAAAGKYAAVFGRMQADYGISPGLITAFWAFETDFGQVQGDFNTLNALVTLAHDCRRPDLFRPQVLAALSLYEMGDFDPAKTSGAWAGEVGMVQMLPRDILERGVDGDGDGRITLKTSIPDALLSGASMLASFGWQPNQPWLQEVVVPAGLDWAKTGLDTELPVSQWAALGVEGRSAPLAKGLSGSILLPQGRKGPAFITYPNYRVLFEWNKSFVYVTTAAYFATRLEGAPPYDAGQPDPGLSGDDMVALQKKLAARGHDVGKIDGILGAATRSAVQKEQVRLGLPADAWPTRDLLGAL